MEILLTQEHEHETALASDRETVAIRRGAAE